jgi:tetratricopeptide (TPR) repeat protein
VSVAPAESRSREVEDLATLLWYSEPSGSPAERTARTEARTLLQDLAKAGTASETALFMLAVAEITLGDAVASAATLDELILRFPQSPRMWRYRARRAWLELRAHNPPRAAEIIQGADLAAESTPSAVHYIAGWLAYDRGDRAHGYSELVAALEEWADLWSWDTLRTETYQLAALADASPDYMKDVIAATTNGPPRRNEGTASRRIRTVFRNGRRTTVVENSTVQYSRPSLYVELGQAYERWGKLAEASAVLKEAIADDPMAAIAANRELMQIAVAENHPAEAAELARSTAAALARADGTIDVFDMKVKLGQAVKRLAVQYRAFADVTRDAEYRAAAEQLLQLVTRPKDDVAAADPYRSAVIDAQLEWMKPRLTSCYAVALQREPDLAGTVAFEVSPAADGGAAVTKVEPGAADHGLGSIGACVAKIVADWRMSQAPMAQRTKVRVELAFKPR